MNEWLDEWMDVCMDGWSCHNKKNDFKVCSIQTFQIYKHIAWALMGYVIRISHLACLCSSELWAILNLVSAAGFLFPWNLLCLQRLRFFKLSGRFFQENAGISIKTVEFQSHSKCPGTWLKTCLKPCWAHAWSILAHLLGALLGTCLEPSCLWPLGLEPAFLYGSHMDPMGIHNIRLRCDPYGSIWDLSGIQMDPSGSYMDPYGSQMGSIWNPNGSIWDPSGSKWDPAVIHMGPYDIQKWSRALNVRNRY